MNKSLTCDKPLFIGSSSSMDRSNYMRYMNVTWLFFFDKHLYLTGHWCVVRWGSKKKNTVKEIKLRIQILSTSPYPIVNTIGRTIILNLRSPWLNKGDPIRFLLIQHKSPCVKLTGRSWKSWTMKRIINNHITLDAMNTMPSGAERWDSSRPPTREQHVEEFLSKKWV